MKLNTLVSSHLRFPQVYFKFKLLILSALLLDPGASQEATATTNNYFAALPKCRDSSLGDEIGIPRSLIAVQDLWNNTSESIPIRLAKNDNPFTCGKEQGRETILQVALHNLHDVTKILTIFRNGYILHDKAYFSKQEYCVLSTIRNDDQFQFTISIKICEPRCSSPNNVCIQKCCQPEKVWDLKHYSRGNGALSCEPPGERKWKPALYIDQHERMDPTQEDGMNIRYMNAHPKTFCEGGFFLVTLKDYDGIEASPFRVLKSGKVLMKIGRNFWEELPSSMYCVDGAMNFNVPAPNDTQDSGETFEMGQYSGRPEDTVLLVCTGFLEDTDDEFNGGPNLLYVVAMIVASVFLFLTAIVYGILWKRQNILFLGYVLSLLLTFIFLSMAHLANGEFDCAFIGIACHFFFLSTFTWLSALNFDIYWTFRSLNPNPGKRKEIIRFIVYTVFAVGVPVTIVTVGLILDSVYGDDPESEVIVPRYGVTRCTMDKYADLPYLFGPISFLLGCNVILFPTTLYHIYKSQKISKLSGMKSSMLKHKIRFFGKLFILAGITWIFEVISWACTDPGKPVHWIWRLLDLVNILQAIAIFVVFVCNRKTLQELSEKFPSFKRINTIIEKATGAAVANSGRKLSNTNVSSVFDVSGLGMDTVELSVK